MRRATRQAIVLRGLVDGVRICAQHAFGRIEHSQAEARQHQALHGCVDLLLADQALLDSGQQRLIRLAAVEIAAFADAERRRAAAVLTIL